MAIAVVIFRGVSGGTSSGGVGRHRRPMMKVAECVCELFLLFLVRSEKRPAVRLNHFLFSDLHTYTKLHEA